MQVARGIPEANPEAVRKPVYWDNYEMGQTE